MRAVYRPLSLSFLLLLLLVGCGTDKSSAPSLTGAPGQTPSASDHPTTTVWPVALPADGVQPWETTDAAGHVVPAARGLSSINSSSIFAAGADSFTTGGSVTALGEASRLDGAVPGSAGQHLAFATYRLPLGGTQPGVVGLDVNLDLPGSSYYVGLSDYSTGHWQWRGPFHDNHVRLVKTAGQLDSANYLSPLGNLFVAVLAYDGSQVEVIGVGANPVSDGDAALPPAPGAFAATPEPGGLLLEWTPSAAADLAGYRVLWSTAGFTSATAPGVQTYDYADGGGRLFLPLPYHYTFVALQAIDIAGNASPLTTVLNAVPLPGAPPVMTVTPSAPSGLHDTPITLTASGAHSYDFDLDGDGLYDVTGNTTGTAQVDTSKPGIIRPGVRGHSADGTAIALGGVSLIITGNTRPAVSASATPQSGSAPLQVSFTATGQDAEDPQAALTYAWDFEGAGIFGAGTNQAAIQHTYTTPGTYNAKVRVTDTQGAWAVDTETITVSPEDLAPTASFTVAAQQHILPLKLAFQFDGSQSHDDGPIATYAWDPLGTGSFIPPSSSPNYTFSYPGVGTYNALLKVADFGGQTDIVARPVYVPSVWSGRGGTPGTTTRQSPIVGAQTNHLKWTFTAPDVIMSGAVLGADGTVYVGCGDSKVYALADNGTATPTVKWSFATGAFIYATPAVGADGTVYASSNDGKVYALVDNGSPTPTLKWSFATGAAIFASPTIGPDGLVYIGSTDNTLYVLKDNGTPTPDVKWSTSLGAEIYSSVTLGPDGSVYVSSDEGQTLLALQDSGTPFPNIKWGFVAGDAIQGTVAIGPDGTIYIGSWDGKLYALKDNGTSTPTVKWSYATADRVNSSPAIGSDGTVYCGSDDYNVFALAGDGATPPTLVWSFPTGGLVGFNSPTIGADGTVYIGSQSGTIFALTRNATNTPTVKWSYTAGGPIYGNPAIGPDGCVYQTCEDSKLYCFGQ